MINQAAAVTELREMSSTDSLVGIISKVRQIMKVIQKDAYLNEQETPGDHRAINRRGDCAQFEPRERQKSLLSRLLSD